VYFFFLESRSFFFRFVSSVSGHSVFQKKRFLRENKMPGGDEGKTSVGESKDAESKASEASAIRLPDGEGKTSEEEEEDIIKRATKYCFSDNFIGIFERYIQKNAYIFKDAITRDVTGDEHRLEYMDSFKDYLVVFEDTMHDWLEDEGITFRQFQEKLSLAKLEGSAYDKYFVKLLIASGEYDCYYDVMVKEAMKQFGPDAE